MMLSVDFFSFRSPFSYLALPEDAELSRRGGDLAVNLRPVYPLAVRVRRLLQEGQPELHSLCGAGLTPRVAEHEGIPFRFPRPDPIVQDLTTLEVATEQPTSIA